MSDLIRVHLGFSPWRPSEDADLVAQLEYYEIPLRGVVEQHGCFHYFECVQGGLSEVGLWLYIPVSDDRVRDLRRATSAEEIGDRALDGEAVTPFVAAIAAEGQGIVAHTVVNAGMRSQRRWSGW